jgi:hypothetical protein
MNPSTRDQAIGKLHQVRGRLEEEVGRLELEARGKTEGGPVTAPATSRLPAR